MNYLQGFGLTDGQEMAPLSHRNFWFGLRHGAHLEIPDVDLSQAERIALVASVARALKLEQIDRAIQEECWWAF